MIKFEYTDTKGKVTQRECIILKEPRDNYLMLDTADILPCNISYINKMLAKKTLSDKTFLKDIGAKYRSFNPDRMKIK
jgi:hypothetical protein